jgi:hypothetical protein
MIKSQNKSFFLIVLIFFALASQARAGDLSPAEIRTLTDYYAQYVHVVTKPFYVFHWQADASQHANELHGTAPTTVQAAQRLSDIYWKTIKSPGNGNTYGDGFYTSAGPTATADYGGTDPTLLQIQIDRGFKMLDLGGDDDAAQKSMTSNPTVQALLKKAGCNSSGLISALFNNCAPNSPTCAKESVPRSCAKVLEQVFKNKLNIDGLAYPYLGHPLPGCESSDVKRFRSAFVITNSARLSQSRVKAFTRFTQDALEDRIRIQSEFYGSTLSDLDILKYRIQNDNRTMIIQSTDTKCDDVKCALTFHLMSINDSSSISTTSTTLPRSAIYPVISGSKIPSEEPKDFFSKDLEGKPLTADLAKWNQENLYGCSGQAQTVGLKEYEASRSVVQGSCKAPATDNTQVNIQDLGKVVKKACDQTTNE